MLGHALARAETVATLAAAISIGLWIYSIHMAGQARTAVHLANKANKHLRTRHMLAVWVSYPVYNQAGGC